MFDTSNSDSLFCLWSFLMCFIRNFRICLVLEVWSKVEEAIPYCQKAISLCKSRLKRLSEDVEPTPLPENDASIVKETGSGMGDTAPPIDEGEKEVLSDILSELERKVTTFLLLLSYQASF